jgi:hypothetical protein
VARRLATKTKTLIVPETSLVKATAGGKLLTLRSSKWDLVYDEETKRWWARKHIEVQSQPEAVKFAAEVRIGKFVFACPTRKQQLSLVDDTRCEPAIDIRFFPECPKSGWFWTQTPCVWSRSSYAWAVYASFGFSYAVRPDLLGFVRAVSAGQ